MLTLGTLGMTRTIKLTSDSFNRPRSRPIDLSVGLISANAVNTVLKLAIDDDKVKL